MFAKLSASRGWRSETIAIVVPALFGGAPVQFIEGPARAEPLSLEGVIAYAGAYGFSGDGLVETVDDILMFDECFLRLARERARDQLKGMNR